MSNFKWTHGQIEGDVEVAIDLNDLLEDVPVETIIEAVGEREIRESVLETITPKELHDALSTSAIDELFTGEEAIEAVLHNNSAESIVAGMEPETVALVGGLCGHEMLTPHNVVETIKADDVLAETVGEAVMAEPEHFGIRLPLAAPELLEVTSKPLCDGVTEFLIDDASMGVMISNNHEVTVRYRIERHGAWWQNFTADSEAQAVNIFNAIMNWNRATVVALPVAAI